MNGFGGRAGRRRRSLQEWLLLIEAGSWLLLARAALRLIPVARIVRWIRRPMRKTVSGSVTAVVEQCRWAVTAFSRNAPVRLVCFPQALALHAMLRRRGLSSEVLYGAARLEGGELVAHAWLRWDGVVIVGGETAGSFSVLDTWSPGALWSETD
jgi:hypothetical protein